MLNFEIILGLLLIASLVQPAARRLDVPLAIGQVVCGLVLSAVPIVRRVRIDPELAFTLFVPPLLFWAATTGSLRDVRRNASPILLLATALVIITTAAVAVVAHAIAPELTWPSAFVLGAIVSPPDADVTTSVARRLGVPPRVVTILEGETLLNDTAAFVTYRMAVRVTVMGGLFSFAEATARFALIAAGGFIIGLIIGWLLGKLTRFGADPVAETTFSLVTPFAAYLFAEHVGASGVLAVVTVPYTTMSGAPFPGRDTVIAVAFCVVIVTLVVQGLTLRPLIKRLCIPHDDVVDAEERLARTEAARAGIGHLERLMRDEGLPRPIASYLQSTIRRRTQLDLDEIGLPSERHHTPIEDLAKRVERDVREAARLAVVRLRDENVIGQEVLRRVLIDLDLDEIRSG